MRWRIHLIDGRVFDTDFQTIGTGPLVDADMYIVAAHGHKAGRSPATRLISFNPAHIVTVQDLSYREEA